MGAVGIALLVLFIISAVLLIIIVMLQDEQGEGLGGIFGGGSSSAFGSRSGNVLTKFTSVLGIIFILSAFSFAWYNRSVDNSDVLKAAKEKMSEQDASNWWEVPEE
ncbi:MAG: preprotein translocase subunit SecG [Spirochaetales bacterium]|nr:preprotein translocase subunit SecG [Spirochaetales bacterium]